MNVLVVAEESAGAHVLRAVARSIHRIVAVMSSPSSKARSGVSVWDLAMQLGLPTWPAALVKNADFAEQISADAVDIILNVHSLYICHAKVVEAPRVGAFNLHPGPLPRYAGLNSVSWALYRGEHTHGVTIHRMVPDVDAGPVAYQSVFTIDKEDTALSLSRKCAQDGVKLLLQLLDVADADPESIPCVPQDLSHREYFGREVPENGSLAWSWKAANIVNFVRACDYLPFRSPWGHPRTTLLGQEVEVLKARLTGDSCEAVPGTVARVTDQGALVACADEWLDVNRIKISDHDCTATGSLHLPARTAVTDNR
jgi:methionyl-tRNA formyltransferase